MKTVSNLRYVFFAISILGIFANYAQNEYGMTVAVTCNVLISLTTLAGVFILAKEIWKEKRSTLLFGAFASICLFCLILFNLLGFFSIADTDLITILMFALLGLFVLEAVAVIITNRKSVGPNARGMVFESFCLIVLLAVSFMKEMHWAGGAPLMLIGAISLSIIYIGRIVNAFRLERQQSGGLAILSALLYFNCVVAALAFAFKNLHWPFGPALCISATALLIFYLVLILFNIKLNDNGNLVSLRSRFVKLNSLTIFIFIYVNYFALYITLQIAGIGPRTYSLSRTPAFQKMIDDNATGELDYKIETYAANYESFLENRRKEAN